MTRRVVFSILFAISSLPLLARAHADLPEPSASEAISWSEIGARAKAQYDGDGLSIVPGEDGAVIHSIFQRLRGDATPGGLWLESTVGGSEADRFRVMATGVGRSESKQRSAFDDPLRPTNDAPRTMIPERRTSNQVLPATGRIEIGDSLVRFIRPGLIEEYSTNMEGVRQDFLVLERPEGEGEFQVELAVDGARAEEAHFGPRLVLENSGRNIAYSRLHVEDAEGRVLPARIEVAAANRLVIVVDDMNAAYPVRIDPTFSDENWISMGGLRGTNGIVRAAVAVGDGTLFVGGDFTIAGDVAANRIARWDGSSWSALGSGMDGSVYALAISGSNLYAGGEFTTAGGESANYIARWNGSSWLPLDSGTGGSVRALAISGNDVYAGGEFTEAGDVMASYIAQWDGISWSALGSGTNGRVLALTASGDGIYAGGRFTEAGEVMANYIAQWDGNSWSALGSGMSGWVHTLAASGDDLYAGGSFTTAGGSSVNNIARWDGSSWLALESGVNNPVNALAISGGELYAGGSFTMASGVSANRFARWDGSSWAALGLETPGRSEGLALAFSGGDLYAGGDFTTTGEGAHFIARWDGSSWSVLGTGIDGSGLWRGTIAALAFFDGDLHAGGFFNTAGGVSANHIARWDGSSWSALGLGLTEPVLALTTSGEDLYAGMAYSPDPSWPHPNHNWIRRWDGSSWSFLPSGMNGSILALAISGGDLYAGGSFTSVGGMSAKRITRWDGNSWSALGSGMSGWVGALAVSGGDLYAGGAFTTAGGSSVNNIARWDGSSWLALESGVNGSVYAMATSEDNLYVGGEFTTAGGESANHIARWDGSSWSALGLGVNGSVYALAISGSNLYAGGDFTTAGGVTVNNIARWDGGSWSALGSGTEGPVRALTVSGRDLYAGGEFIAAGGKVSTYLAKTSIAVSLSDGTVVEQREPGTVVGILGAMEPDDVHEQTVFSLVSGPGDDDNASFTIDGDELKTVAVFDYHVQNLFSIRVQATFGDGTHAEKVFLLRANRDGFLLWADDLPPDGRGKTDDPGDHGIPNLLRYAFGMDAIAPDPEALPRPVLSEATGQGKPQFHLALTYTRRTDDPDLIFTPEASEDLATWVPLVDAEEIFGSDGFAETVIVTDPEPVDTKPAGFLRVRVERND